MNRNVRVTIFSICHGGTVFVHTCLFPDIPLERILMGQNTPHLSKHDNMWSRSGDWGFYG